MRLLSAFFLAGILSAQKPSPFPARNPKRIAAPPAQSAPAPQEAKPKPTDDRPVTDLELCRATFYGDNMEGGRTASGETLRNGELTFAHPSLPFDTRAKLTNLANRKSIEARVNDRLGAGDMCRINLTKRGARELDFLRAGSADVRVEILK